MLLPTLFSSSKHRKTQTHKPELLLITQDRHQSLGTTGSIETCFPLTHTITPGHRNDTNKHHHCQHSDKQPLPTQPLLSLSSVRWLPSSELHRSHFCEHKLTFWADTGQRVTSASILQPKPAAASKAQSTYIVVLVEEIQWTCFHPDYKVILSTVHEGIITRPFGLAWHKAGANSTAPVLNVPKQLWALPFIHLFSLPLGIQMRTQFGGWQGGLHFYPASTDTSLHLPPL